MFNGVGKAMGGWVLKNMGAVIGQGAYVVQRVRKEMHRGRESEPWVKKMRLEEVLEDSSLEGREGGKSKGNAIENEALQFLLFSTCLPVVPTIPTLGYYLKFTLCKV